MFLTWLTSAVIAGEVALYAVFLAVDRGRPRRIGHGGFYFFLCVGLFAMAGTSLFAYLDMDGRLEALGRASSRHRAVAEFMDNLRDMELAHRGYLLTGRESYLEPYVLNRRAQSSACAAVRAAYAGTAEVDAAESLCRMGGLKVEELEAAVKVKRAGKLPENLEQVRADLGKKLTDVARQVSSDLMRRSLADQDSAREDLERVTRARIAMAALVVLGSVIQMVFGAAKGWPAGSPPS
jgi:CHASE3 domain sensor protein